MIFFERIRVFILWAITVVVIVLCLLTWAKLGHTEEPAEECAFHFYIKNPTDVKIIYRVKWFSHPFETMYPSNIASGEMEPGGFWVSKHAYRCGEYTVEFDHPCIDYYHAFTHRFSETKEFTVPEPRCDDE